MNLGNATEMLCSKGFIRDQVLQKGSQSARAWLPNPWKLNISATRGLKFRSPILCILEDGSNFQSDPLSYQCTRGCGTLGRSKRSGCCIPCVFGDISPTTTSEGMETALWFTYLLFYEHVREHSSRIKGFMVLLRVGIGLQIVCLTP